MAKLRQEHLDIIKNSLADAILDAKRQEHPLKDAQVEILISSFAMNIEDRWSNRWKEFDRTAFEDYVRSMSLVNIKVKSNKKSNKIKTERLENEESNNKQESNS